MTVIVVGHKIFKTHGSLPHHLWVGPNDGNTFGNAPWNDSHRKISYKDSFNSVSSNVWKNADFVRITQPLLNAIISITLSFSFKSIITYFLRVNRTFDSHLFDCLFGPSFLTFHPNVQVNLWIQWQTASRLTFLSPSMSDEHDLGNFNVDVICQPDLRAFPL